MFFTDRKLEARLYELASYRYRDGVVVTVIYGLEKL